MNSFLALRRLLTISKFSIQGTNESAIILVRIIQIGTLIPQKKTRKSWEIYDISSIKCLRWRISAINPQKASRLRKAFFVSLIIYYYLYIPSIIFREYSFIFMYFDLFRNVYLPNMCIQLFLYLKLPKVQPSFQDYYQISL